MFKNLYENSVANTYGRFDVEIVKGNGAVFYDTDNKKYIDFTSGIGVNSLGFCDNDWSRAVSEQAAKLNHISNLYYTQPAGELAEKLTSITGYSKVFFSNSGAEANEGAIKAARKYSYDKYGEGRFTILSLENSFHGRTLTTLSATAQPALQKGFSPLTCGFKYVPAGDIDAIKQRLTDDVCAVMLEYIQGEGGVNVLEKDYIEKLYALCAKKDILIIADEVQTGIGRTGKILCGEHYNVKADITTLAKGLGGGLPIGAVLFNEKTSQVLGHGTHGTTYGGNPIVCAGANVVLNKICEKDFLESVIKKGDYIRQELESYAKIDGIGLMLGLNLKDKTALDVVKQAIEKGLLTLTAKEKLRLLPPLNINKKELIDGVAILKEII